MAAMSRSGEEEEQEQREQPGPVRAATDAAAPFRLRARLVPTRTTALSGGDGVAADECVLVDVALRNDSADPLWFPHDGPLSPFEVAVVDEDTGEAMPMTRYGRQVYGPPAPPRRRPGEPVFASRRQSLLEPGRENAVRVPASLLFDMTAPGTYRVRVTARLPRPGAGAPVEVACEPVRVHNVGPSLDSQLAAPGD